MQGFHAVFAIERLKRDFGRAFLFLLFSFLIFIFMFVIYFRIVALNLEIMLNVFDLYFGLKVLSICWVFY